MKNKRETVIEELLGKTITEIIGAEEASDEVEFMCNDGTRYKMFHWQECCESVYLADIVGKIEDLIGSPITMAEKVTNEEDEPLQEYDWSYTWTFYKLATVKGYVTLRWFGTSNGYYSEEVDFVEMGAE